MTPNGVSKLSIYTCRRTFSGGATPAASQNLDFFDVGGSLTAPEYNDLNERGELPDGSQGMLARVFANWDLPWAESTFTSAERDAAAAYLEEFRMNARVTVSIAGVIITEAPFWSFGMPGSWATGSANAGVNNHFALQNSGYLLAFEGHPIHRDARTKVNVKTRVPMSAAGAFGTTVLPGVILGIQVAHSLPVA